MNYCKRNKQIIACCLLLLAGSWILPPNTLAGIQAATLAPKFHLNALSRPEFFLPRKAETVPRRRGLPAAKSVQLAEKEWQTAGNPQLFPKTPFDIRYLCETDGAKVSAATVAINKHYKKSLPVIDATHLDYFFDFFSYTRMFTDHYQASYRRVLEDFISGDNALLLSMFRIAFKHYSFRRTPSGVPVVFSYFYRFPWLEEKFLSNLEAILREKAKTHDHKVTILVLGSALGEEAMTWAWLLRNKLASSPGFDNINFKIIGIEKNAAVFHEAVNKLETGYNLLTVLGHILVNDDDPPLITKRIEMMNDVNNNLAEYAKNIRFELAMVPISAGFPKLIENADMVISNMLWMYLNKLQRTRLLALLEQKAQQNKPFYVMGMDVDKDGLAVDTTGKEASQPGKADLKAADSEIKLKNLNRFRGVLENGLLSILEQVQNGQENLSSVDQHDGRAPAAFNPRIHANFTHPGLLKHLGVLTEGLFYNRFQGLVPVAMERFYDKKAGLIAPDRFNQQDFESILSERAQHSMVVLIDPAKISALNKAHLKELRSVWDVHAPFFPHEITFADAFVPESIVKIFIPQKFAQSLGAKALENEKVILVPDEIEREMEIYRPVDLSPAVTITKGRKGSILMPDYARTITPHLLAQEYLVHVVRFFAPSDMDLLENTAAGSLPKAPAISANTLLFQQAI
ncbi:MAG: hypothetical protein ABII75_09565 [Candidatus Omnitrophota bacterium]